jgi:SSS family solute:Na+ symporter
MQLLHSSAFLVFAAILAAVSVLGFLGARWKRGDLDQLDEWGLGGRQFGTLITWFLVGGDFYTAYTIIAVPALVFGTGAMGFFALPYTIIVYPFVFLAMPRLWSVARKHGYITPADFVQGRYGSRTLATLVALTGITATMPYIALQLAGMGAVLTQLGLTGNSWVQQDLPLVVAFLVLALYTYSSGLRAPAIIAIVKDVLIYVVVIAAILIIPAKAGGYTHIFSAADAVWSRQSTASLILLPRDYTAYASLALGSALAAFMYPHTVTTMLASSSGQVIRRNAVLLPAYTFLLGLIALFGVVAVAAGIHPATSSSVVPELLTRFFSPWFTGLAFAAIALAAMVPAAIMSIGAANLFTRSIYRAWFRPDATAQQESRVAKNVSFGVKFGALLFVFTSSHDFVINLQLLGGIWILQTFPAITFGLWKRVFHHQALIAGWVAGIATGTSMAAALRLHSSVYALTIGGTSIRLYAGIWALMANILVVWLISTFLDRANIPRNYDETALADYQDECDGSGAPISNGVIPCDRVET